LDAAHPQTDQKALLDLIPMGPVDALAVSIIAAHLQTLLGLPTQIHPEQARPDFAYLAARRQYDAGAIIKHLNQTGHPPPFKLGLVAGDLCLPILTYVFGESQLGGCAAVVSLFRLRDKQRHLLYERAAKISLHEVGHLLGLEHCRAADCLMRFSKQLDQLDHLPLLFCSACEYEVARRVAVLNGAS
jgi:archaemetzincin